MKFNDWLKIIGDFKKDKADAVCPNCGKSSIDFQFVGDERTHIGHLYIWCNTCAHGIHISRVKIPEGVNILPYDLPTIDLKKRIPNYKFVT